MLAMLGMASSTAAQSALEPWAPGYAYQRTYKLGNPQPAGTHEFTRGVDVWEDGLIWNATGFNGPHNSAPDVTKCKETSIRVYNPALGASPTLLKEVNVGTAFCRLLGANCPSTLYPTDLACFDPEHSLSSGACPGFTRMWGIAVGGWTKAIPDQFEAAGDSIPDPGTACGIGNPGNAWAYVVQLQRRAFEYDVLDYTGSGDQGLVTFVGNTLSSTVVINTVEGGPSDEPVCTSTPYVYDPTSYFVTGGTFRGTAQFRGPCTIPQVEDPTKLVQRQSLYGSSDAFIARHVGQSNATKIGALVDSNPVCVIASSGEDGIESVTVNPLTSEVVVAGYIGAANADFDPDPATTTAYKYPWPHTGAAQDWFVASYTYVIPAQGAPFWDLNWFAIRDEDDQPDTAYGVAADPSGIVFVGGTNIDAPLMASYGPAIQEYMLNGVGTGYFYPVLNWVKTASSSTTVTIRDVTVDGIGRPIFAGDSNGPVNYECSATNYANPTGQLAGKGGFVLRLDPDDGCVQWGKRIATPSASSVMTCTDATVCQFNSAKLIVGGDFSDSVEFVSGSPVTADGTDGYCTVVDHAPEVGPLPFTRQAKNHITMLMDHFMDVRADPVSSPLLLSQADWLTEIAPVTALFTPTTPHEWFDASVSFQAILYGVYDFNNHNPSNDPSFPQFSRAHTLQLIPVTTIRSGREAKWVARRMQGHQVFRTKGDASNWKAHELSRAVAFAGDFFGYGGTNALFQYPNHAAYRHILAPVYEPPVDGTYPCNFDRVDFINDDVKNEVTEGGFIDQINTIGLVHFGDCPELKPDRDFLKATMVESRVQINPTGIPPGIDGETNLGMVGNAEQPSITAPNPWVIGTGIGGLIPQYHTLVNRMFLRMTKCPSDFNRDGQIQGPFPGGVDAAQFINAYQDQSNPLHIYADWNFDGSFYTFPTSPDPAGEDDAAKFKAGLPTPDGNLPPGDCPNN